MQTMKVVTFLRDSENNQTVPTILETSVKYLIQDLNESQLIDSSLYANFSKLVGQYIESGCIEKKIIGLSLLNCLCDNGFLIRFGKFLPSWLQVLTSQPSKLRDPSLCKLKQVILYTACNLIFSCPKDCENRKALNSVWIPKVAGIAMKLLKEDNSKISVRKNWTILIIKIYGWKSLKFLLESAPSALRPSKDELESLISMHISNAELFPASLCDCMILSSGDFLIKCINTLSFTLDQIKKKPIDQSKSHNRFKIGSDPEEELRKYLKLLDRLSLRTLKFNSLVVSPWIHSAYNFIPKNPKDLLSEDLLIYTDKLVMNLVISSPAHSLPIASIKSDIKETFYRRRLVESKISLWNTIRIFSEKQGWDSTGIDFYLMILAEDFKLSCQYLVNQNASITRKRKLDSDPEIKEDYSSKYLHEELMQCLCLGNTSFGYCKRLSSFGESHILHASQAC